MVFETRNRDFASSQKRESGFKSDYGQTFVLLFRT